MAILRIANKLPLPVTESIFIVIDLKGVPVGNESIVEL